MANGHYLKRVLNCHNDLSTTVIFSSDCWKSQELSRNLIRKARWWLMFHLYCCNKHKLSTILVRFVTLNFFFKTLFKFFCVYFISLYIIYDWYNIMGYSKQERSTKNMYSPKNNFSMTPLLLHSGHLLTKATFYCPRRVSTVLWKLSSLGTIAPYRSSLPGGTSRWCQYCFLLLSNLVLPESCFVYRQWHFIGAYEVQENFSATTALWKY